MRRGLPVRLDKFLSLAGLIRRRTRAQEACQRGYVSLEGKPAKPGRAVRPGQELVVQVGHRRARYRILDLPRRPVTKAAQGEFLEVLEVHTVEPSDD